MKKKLTPVVAFACVLAMAAVAHAQAQPTAPVKVTPETYIRAETDRQFADIAKMAGGVNRFYHFRSPTPLDKQNVVRMNRDTLYSMGVVDTSKGATITVPKLPEGRYASVYLVDNDHYTPLVIYTEGTHDLPKDTKYLGVDLHRKLTRVLHRKLTRLGEPQYGSGLVGFSGFSAPRGLD